jgi:hypothetical protein
MSISILHRLPWCTVRNSGEDVASEVVGVEVDEQSDREAKECSEHAAGEGITHGSLHYVLPSR